MDWKVLLDQIAAWATNVGIKIVISVIILVISFIIINRLSKSIENKGNQASE